MYIMFDKSIRCFGQIIKVAIDITTMTNTQFIISSLMFVLGLCYIYSKRRS